MKTDTVHSVLQCVAFVDRGLVVEDRRKVRYVGFVGVESHGLDLSLNTVSGTDRVPATAD